MRGEPYFMRLAAGIRKPRVSSLGVDLAGEVEAVGKSVTRFKPGDAVFGVARGAWAEYACASESGIVAKPDNVTFDEAASVTVGAMTALQALRRGNIQRGDRVLINGAAGGVGTFAVQLAKSFGAEVTGVCSARNVEMVKSIGADHAIDYALDDFTTTEARYDVIVDCISNQSVRASLRALKRRGVYVIVGGHKDVGLFSRLFGLLLVAPFTSRKLRLAFTRNNEADMQLLHDLLASREIRPVIDRRYSLDDISSAVAYVEKQHARGKVIISLAHAET